MVFIIGTARDQAEIDRVIDYGRNMDGVKRVVSYIRIRASAPIETGPDNAGDPAPGDTAPNAPTPRSDIVVTPLSLAAAGTRARRADAAARQYRPRLAAAAQHTMG